VLRERQPRNTEKLQLACHQPKPWASFLCLENGTTLNAVQTPLAIPANSNSPTSFAAVLARRSNSDASEMASAAQFILSARASFFSFLRLNGGTCGRSSVFEHQSAQYWKAEKRHLEGERKIRALRRSTDFDDQAGRFYDWREEIWIFNNIHKNQSLNTIPAKKTVIPADPP